METDAVPQQGQEKAEAVESADLVIGILPEIDPSAQAAMLAPLRGLSGPLRVAILQNRPAATANRAAGLPETAANLETSPKDSSVVFLPSPLPRPDSAAAGVLRMAAMYQSIFAASEKLQARGCCIIASELEAGTPRWIYQLTEPLVERNVDLVLPHYTRRKFQGLINNSIIAPLTRALYGKRVSNPMGPDFGISRRLFRKMLGTERSSWADGNALHPLASLTPAALCENLQVNEVYVGARVYPPTDWTNLSSLLTEVLSPVFLDMERNAACWQRTRFSVPVPAFGESLVVRQDTGTLDVTRMVESFQLGNRELQEIWGLVLPPSTLFELRKLSRIPVEQFHMADELWVRIVYDFAVAHRLRTISRDHLLRSMTPLYLAWVASYAHDLQTGGGTFLERRLERLSLAYETGKPYLVSRWRWPDRFNP